MFRIIYQSNHSMQEVQGMVSSVNVSTRRAHLSLLDLTVVLCCGNRSPSEISEPARASPGSILYAPENEAVYFELGKWLPHPSTFN